MQCLFCRVQILIECKKILFFVYLVILLSYLDGLLNNGNIADYLKSKLSPLFNSITKRQIIKLAITIFNFAENSAEIYI